MATEIKPSVAKVRPYTSTDGSSRPGSSLKIKKIESSGRQIGSDTKSKSGSSVAKTAVKLKTTSSSSNNTKATKSSKPREKKVFSLPGQKYDPPEEREPLRIFYESLSKQIPTSEMAEFWMMEHGLLSPERAKKAYEKKQRKQKLQRMGAPIKPSKPQSKPESSQKQQQPSQNGDLKQKKRIEYDSDDDDDLVFSPKRRKINKEKREDCSLVKEKSCFLEGNLLFWSTKSKKKGADVTANSEGHGDVRKRAAKGVLLYLFIHILLEQ